MLTRQNVANFLQGLFVAPLCALFGLMVALLFHWRGGSAWAAVAFCALFPLAGALKTRQHSLTFGLLAGLALAAWAAVVLLPHR